jgi:hypothetical protein
MHIAVELDIFLGLSLSLIFMMCHLEEMGSERELNFSVPWA